METKVINVHGKKYKVLPDSEGACMGCAVYLSNKLTCADFTLENNHNCDGVIFQEIELLEVKQPVSLNFNLELDFSSSILPTQFKVKSLKLSSLDDALAKGTENYTISTQSLNQEQIQAVAEGLKQEFIRRNTKEVK